MSTILTASTAAAVALASGAASESSSLLDHYRSIRRFSETLCAPLETEDYGIQSMADVSPPKWHLGHVSWFFETFLLRPHLPGYELFHPKFGYIFNSYYEAVGARHPRPQRGLLSRPTVAEVYGYRAHVDAAMEKLIGLKGEVEEIAALIVLGLHHEQQHQELLVTDIKHILAINPLRPAYREDLQHPLGASIPRPTALEFVPFTGGVIEIGRDVSGLEARFEAFAFDNEGPRHRVFVEGFAIAHRPVTNGEYLEFIEAGGYGQPQHWLSEGWGIILKHQWQAPLYWEKIDGVWAVMTLGGLQPLNLAEPVCHVSLYEADAYASWAGKRLPTEAEWELVAQAQLDHWQQQGQPMQGNFVEGNPAAQCKAERLHPSPCFPVESPPMTHDPFPITQLFGDVWEWTQSAYLPYPGFKIAEGAIGEYNGKFMCGQRVLRGGSCATPISHIRATYRNFFPPASRWQFSGIRLAQSLT